jgi:glycosyltransferase involved in cell wall biosynthesis
MPKLKAAAAPNIELLGYQEFSVLKHHLQRARAFVFAAEEDFGITPVEAQACGTPVIAFGRGGALETVVMSPDPAQATGVFFPEQTVESLVEAVHVFESHPEGFRPEVCRRHAERFSVDQFRQSFSAYVTARVTEFRESLR